MEIVITLIISSIAYSIGWVASETLNGKQRPVEKIMTIVPKETKDTELAKLVHEIMKQEWTQRDNAHSVGLVVRNYVSRIKEIMK